MERAPYAFFSYIPFFEIQSIALS